MLGYRFFVFHGGLKRIILLLFGLSLLPGCEYLGLWPGQHAPVPVVGVEVTSTAIVLAPGEEIQVRAAPIYGEYRDRWERPFPPVPIEWTSSDPSIIEVLAGGHLQAHRSGRVTLTAKGRGHRDTATVVVRPSPEPVETPFVKISVGGASCALDSAGVVSCWGSNLYGAVGTGDPRNLVNYMAPVPVGGAIRFRDVASGTGITCGLATDGTALCWGQQVEHRVPTPIPGEIRFVEVTATSFTSCGRTAAGEVFCWGRGFGVTPVRIPLPQPVREIDGHCGLTEAGVALCWSADRQVETFSAPSPFAQISSGFASTCALDVNGRAFCWGANETGELGTGPPTDTCRVPGMPFFRCQPQPAPVLGNLTFTALAVGNRFACGVAENGAAYCWGGNWQGQLATGGFTPADRPVPVVGGLAFRSLAAREAQVCGVTVDGAGYCWGNAYTGGGRTWTIAPDHTTGTAHPTRVRNPL